ncbi:MAG TPA: hypothetical protein VGO57_08275 [Verrucomicrobiae bacterium]|jgi:hypothetical protein
MKSKKANQKNLLNSKLAAYSITATGALLGAPAMSEAQGMLQNITQFSYDGGATFISTPPSVSNQDVSFRAMNAQFERISLHAQNNSGAARASIGGWIAVNSHFEASRLAPGAQVAGRLFTDGSGAYLLASHTNHGGANHGNFLPTGANGVFTGYAAFEARASAGHTYYGWLRIKITNDANGVPAQVAVIDKNGDGIYGALDSKNDPNLNNFTAGMIEAVPEPSLAALGGLGLLAFGARGVRELRRRRQAAAKTN